MAAEMTVLWLPYPPSANRYLRHTARGTYRTEEANRYRDSAEIEATLSHSRKLSGPVALKITLHPKLTKSGHASKTCIDLDNCMKVAVDALQGILYENDRQIAHIEALKSYPVIGGALAVVATCYGEAAIVEGRNG